MINTNIIVSGNSFVGFQNYSGPVPFSASYAGGSIAAGGFVGPVRASVTLNNTNAISQIQVQYVGQDAFTRVLPGIIIANYPNATSPSYQIESFSYFSGGTLFVDSYISNQTGSSVVVPAITFSCQAFLYIAPFKFT